MKYLVILLFLLTACNHESETAVVIDIDPETRICQLDNTGQSHVKCWGKCGSVSGQCLIRWRPVGSTDPWDNNGGSDRERDAVRDSELEYGCYCG